MSDHDNGTQASKIFSLFDQGKKFTEDLLKENERLRHLVGELTQERDGLEKRATANGITHMQDKIRVLETDLAQLRHDLEQQKTLTSEIESENREFADRYVEIERQNTNLINMYVASYQLHSTLDFSEVLIIVRDIVINMLGAETLGLYLVDEKTNQLELAIHEGMPDECLRHLTIDDSMRELLAGPVIQDPTANPSGSPLDGGPIAIVPLQLDDRPVGLIYIYKLLIQKHGLQTVDLELFELLCKHAATAIYSAQLHARSERKRATLEGVVELIRSSRFDSPKTQ